MNDYYKLYIKYKNKYLNLKKQIAGSADGKFYYSVNNPNTLGEYYSGQMFDKIDEFKTQTIEPYINSSIREVNMVEMAQNKFVIEFFRKNPKNRELLSDKINEFIMKDDWYEYLLYITRFYNSTILYNNSTLDSGVIVLADNLSKVFKDNYINSDEYKLHINNNDDYEGTKRKGFGNDNLLCTLNNIKKFKNKLEVLYLHANGDMNLVKYYQSIGFNILLTNVVPHYNNTGKALYPYEYFMFGLFDNIIEKLKSKAMSNCDNMISNPI
jgi:hypothetical protein